MKRFSSKSQQESKIITKEEALENLKKFYEQIPETEGCLENICKEDGCKSWCCSKQNAQVLQVEFLYAWSYVLKHFSNEEIIILIERAFRNYLNDDFSKGCVFHDEETKLCKIHKVRGFNCFLYGITPENEFNERYERLKEEHKNEIGADIRPQCKLVRTIDRGIPTKEETDQWWQELKEIEKSIGIKESDIHDGSGGSYRTYHDYILMRFLPDEILQQMTVLRLYGGIEEKEQFVCNAMEYLRKKINHLSETEDEKP